MTLRKAKAGSRSDQIMPRSIVGETRYVIENAHLGSVSAVVFSPDGTLIASGSLDGDLIFWDPQTRSMLAREEKAHQGWAISSLSFSPGSTRRKFILASGGLNGKVCVWNIERKPDNSIAIQKLEKELPAGDPGYRVESIRFCPNRPSMLAAGYKSFIKVWDGVGGPNPVNLDNGRLQRDQYSISSVGFNPRQNLPANSQAIALAVVTQSRAFGYYKWDGNSLTQDLGTTISLGLDKLSFLSCNTDHKEYLVGIAGPTVYIYSLREAHTALKQIQIEKKSNCLAVNNRSDRLAVAMEGTGIYIWGCSCNEITDFSGGDWLPERYKLTTPGSSYALSIDFSPDGHGLAAGCNNHSILLWDLP